MTTNEIIKRIQTDITSGKIKVQNKDGYRIYTDGNKFVPITNPDETTKLYYETFIQATTVMPVTSASFDSLPRCTIYVGQPDTGKTYKAQNIAKELGIPSLLIMARDNLNLETLLEDFTLVDGKPVFQESLAIKMLSGTENGIIIIDEFNTLLTGVMKTLQPLLDTTSTTFEYKGKVYTKNPNCKFILTLNDKDKGISVIPDAILSRSKVQYFTTPDINTLAQWTGQSDTFVKNVLTLYKTLNLLSIFGTRQINIISNMTSAKEITDHLVGLCSLRGMETNIITAIETQRLIGALCTSH